MGSKPSHESVKGETEWCYYATCSLRGIMVINIYKVVELRWRTRSSWIATYLVEIIYSGYSMVMEVLINLQYNTNTYRNVGLMVLPYLPHQTPHWK
jgi:hypothetical protein